MTNPRLFILTITMLLTNFLLANNSGTESVKKYLESKQIEYKNSVKDGGEMNIEFYNTLNKKLLQVKSNSAINM